MAKPKTASIETPAADAPALVTTAKEGALELQEAEGKTTIHEEVIAKVAGLAIRSVPGVHALVPYGPGQAITSFARTIGRADEAKDLGVRVEVGQVEAAIDCRIITHFGASIPEVSTGIRKALRDAIGVATGLKLKEANIEVVDLYFADEEEPVVKELPPRVQ